MKSKFLLPILITVVLLSSCAKNKLCDCTYVTTGLPAGVYPLEGTQFLTHKMVNKKLCSSIEDDLNKNVTDADQRVGCELH